MHNGLRHEFTVRRGPGGKQLEAAVPSPSPRPPGCRHLLRPITRSQPGGRLQAAPARRPALYLFLARSFHTRPDLGFPFGTMGTSASSFRFLGAGAWAEGPVRSFGQRPSLASSGGGGEGSGPGAC